VVWHIIRVSKTINRAASERSYDGKNVDIVHYKINGYRANSLSEFEGCYLVRLFWAARNV
jgi:hypothetical protein